MGAVDVPLNFLVATFSKYKETGNINFNNLTTKNIISVCIQHKNFSINILYSFIQSDVSKSAGVFTLLGYHLQVLSYCMGQCLSRGQIKSLMVQLKEIF